VSKAFNPIEATKKNVPMNSTIKGAAK